MLRFFDQLRFHPVSHDELMQIREDFPNGQYPLRIEETELDLHAFHQSLDKNRNEILEWKDHQQQAFDDERARWEAAGQAVFQEDAFEAASDDDRDLPPDCMAVNSPMPGSIWKIQVEPGQEVKPGDCLVIVESMKMEINVNAEEAGVVQNVFCQTGNPVKADQLLVSVRKTQT